MTIKRLNDKENNSIIICTETKKLSDKFRYPTKKELFLLKMLCLDITAHSKTCANLKPNFKRYGELDVLVK